MAPPQRHDLVTKLPCRIKEFQSKHGVITEITYREHTNHTPQQSHIEGTPLNKQNMPRESGAPPRPEAIFPRGSDPYCLFAKCGEDTSIQEGSEAAQGFGEEGTEAECNQEGETHELPSPNDAYLI